MNLVGGDERSDQIASAAMLTFADRERDREIAARMSRVAREIVVVAVEVAQQAAVDERRERRRRFLARADQRGLRVPPQSAAMRRTARPTSLSRAPYAQPSVSRIRALPADTTSAGKSSNRTECTRAASASSAPMDAATAVGHLRSHSEREAA